MLDDIYSKCKGGFKLSENIKSKNFFKNKKEEITLNDLFQKIFEIDMKKRVAISALKEHPALKGKIVEDVST
jgi:biotin synthase-related radical SAM superfamily protein